MAGGFEQWLRDIGLGQYAESLVANAVDLDTLQYLTDDDLKELGLPLGHRRKLQAALRSRANDDAATVSPPAGVWGPDPRPSAADAPAPADGSTPAERLTSAQSVWRPKPPPLVAPPPVVASPVVGPEPPPVIVSAPPAARREPTPARAVEPSPEPAATEPLFERAPEPSPRPAEFAPAFDQAPGPMAALAEAPDPVLESAPDSAPIARPAPAAFAEAPRGDPEIAAFARQSRRLDGMVTPQPAPGPEVPGPEAPAPEAPPPEAPPPETPAPEAPVPEAPSAVLAEIRAEAREPRGEPAVEPRRRGGGWLPRLVGVATRRRSQPRAGVERVITVMYCDLVGTEALSKQLDPEDMGQVVRAYQDSCADVVGRHGGTIAKFMGDGVLAYFGHPKAGQDDAVHAVRAGLGVIDEVGTIEVEGLGRLQTRVGIATGPVAVGEPLDDDDTNDPATIGETPGVAAQLRVLAKPDTVVISDATRRLTGDQFDLADLGRHDIEDLAGAVQAWGVRGVGVADVASAPVSVTTAPQSLIGRDDELAHLVEAWEQARRGAGRVVLVAGAAGIGKSRLLAAMRDHVAAVNHVLLRYVCAPDRNAGALHPIIDQLAAAADFAPQDEPAQRLGKLVTVVREAAGDAGAVLPLFAGLLGLPVERQGKMAKMDPAAVREATIAALIGRLDGLAARGPVLICLEEAQWTDQTSHELFARIIDQVASLPVLLIVSHRPDAPPRWASPTHVSAIELGPLTRDGVAALVGGLAGGHMPSDEVVDEVAARTGGVPLYAEHLTRILIELGALRLAGDRLSLDGALGLAVPGTLEDLILARLDCGPAAKEVVQCAAALGEAFSDDLLQAASQLPAAELAVAIRALQDAALIVADGARYRCAHPLVRQIAYGSMMPGVAKQLHARIAHVMTAELPWLGTVAPAQLAYHLGIAGDGQAAISVWRDAADRAAALAASVEMAAALTEALECVAALPKGNERMALELELRLEIAGPLVAARGYAAAETEHNYTIALDLCRKLGETSRLLPLLYGRWLHLCIGGAVTKCRERAVEILKLANTQSDDGSQAAAHRLMGTSLMLGGEPEAAREYLEGAMSLYDPRTQAGLADRYGQDTGAAVLSALAVDLWLLGHGDQARARGLEALKLAKSAAHAGTTGFAMFHVDCILGLLLRDWKAVERASKELIDCAVGPDLELWRVAGGVAHAAARALRTGKAEDLDAYAVALDAYTALPVGLFLPLLLCLMAEAQALAGQPAEGLVTLDEAASTITHGGEHWIESEVYRLRGELLLAAAPEQAALAETSLRRAVDMAGAQRARTLQLRAAISLARLRRDQGKSGVARAVLGPLLGEFTDGVKLPELKEARDLLREVR